MVYDVIILGSGPAGCAAAIYTARAGFKPLVLEGMQPGGQLTQTSEIENYPGFEEGITGYDLVMKMRAQAERFGATFEMDECTGGDFSGEIKRLETMVAGTLETKTVILATGASARWLGLPNEQRLIGHGVSSCAVCDGAFYKGKTVAVIGGGDTACEDALYLSRLCAKVIQVHRRDTLRASKVMIERVLNNPVIEMAWNATVEDILGAEEGAVKGVILKDTRSGETQTVAVDGVFVAIGHSPNTTFLQGLIDLTPGGYIDVKPGMRTNCPGVFTAGDVQDPHYRQAIVAAGAGAQAALEAERYLMAQAQ